MRLFSREKGVKLEVDVGINVGPITGGVVGRKKFIYDIWGETLDLAQLMNSDGISSTQVTSAVVNRLHGQYEFDRQPDLHRENALPISVYRLRQTEGQIGAMTA